MTAARSTAEYESEECTNLRAGGRCRAAHSDNGEESSENSAEHSGIREGGMHQPQGGRTVSCSALRQRRGVQ